MSLADETAELLEEPLPARVRKILELAEEEGWSANPRHSLVIRLTKEGDKDARPFFARWDLAKSDKGKWSWRWAGARAANAQAMNWNDIQEYLRDPSVIWPEEEGEQDVAAAGDECPVPLGGREPARPAAAAGSWGGF